MPEQLLSIDEWTTLAQYARRMDDHELADKTLRASSLDPVAVTLREILDELRASREESRHDRLQSAEATQRLSLAVGELRHSLDHVLEGLQSAHDEPMPTGEIRQVPVVVEPPILSRCMSLVEQRFDSLRTLVIILAAIAAGGGVTSQTLYLLLGHDSPPAEQQVQPSYYPESPRPMPSPFGGGGSSGTMDVE